MGIFPKGLSFNRLFLKFNWFICNQQQASSPHSLQEGTNISFDTLCKCFSPVCVWVAGRAKLLYCQYSFTMVLTQIIIQVYKDSYFDIPIKFQHLSGIIILILTGRFFDTIIDVDDYWCHALSVKVWSIHMYFNVKGFKIIILHSNFQTFLKHFTKKETWYWPFCIEHDNNMMSHYIEEIHAIKWCTKLI